MRRHIPGVLILFYLLGVVSLIFMPSAVRAEASWDVWPDVLYVPTPPEVVEEMLRLAEVGPGDVVYDLGSGDGRIVIAAARDRGARGVGVEIDPQLIRLSKRNAEREGVAERVRFIEEDLFRMDFSAASVLTLYLLPDLNLRLRPELFRQLRPGTRVVSHAFHMEDWTPDEEARVGRHDIYFWVIPANVSGRWTWRMPADSEDELYELELEQKFQQVSGFLRNDAGLHALNWAIVRGDHLLLVFNEGPGDAMILEGRLAGETLEGSLSRAGAESLAWRALREPGTMKPLETGW
ncbi:Methyltransferase domain-containing protein [Geoalkalibacter ferrihydriticus]|uniref:Methyltransferase domain-containing protein n=1 Tax=Geoalkalibacter ferrihydriticus TaxID=392333 RepID=A0A1G9WA46_9BACT|nr:methyltransferase domain-containing protein [Geoalkalibacter ferrihydriticus]SDM81143.1 Methyltransferase domain-containing protein [Geoalkalibacter ferrihydriticus]